MTSAPNSPRSVAQTGAARNVARARTVTPGSAGALPPGCAGFVVPRSGLALRHGVSLVNTPGLVDAGYRGEVKVLLVNHDPGATVTLRRGERIAQLVVQRIERAELVEVDEL